MALKMHALITLVMFLSNACLAQSPVRDLKSAEVAAAALGSLPGVAAVGVLSGERIEIAVVHRDSPGESLNTMDLSRKSEPLFEIGSVTKIFTGLLVAQRVEAGLLRLDQTVGELLPNIKFTDERTKSITIQQLLSHTSCFRAWARAPDREGVVKQLMYDRERLWNILGSTPLNQAPPCETNYSNVAYAILGELLAQQSGQSWENVVERDILRRISMQNTAQHLSSDLARRLAPAFAGNERVAPWEMNAFAGAGGLRSTATDLLVFTRELLQGRNGAFGAAAGRTITSIAPYRTGSSRIGYGVLLPAAPAKVWASNGLTGGYRAEWVVWPESSEAVVMLVSNSSAPSHGVAQALVANNWNGVPR